MSNDPASMNGSENDEKMDELENANKEKNVNGEPKKVDKSATDIVIESSKSNDDNDSCEYADDPMEDPISTAEPNETQDKKQNDKSESNGKKEDSAPGHFQFVESFKRDHSSEDESSDSDNVDNIEMHETVSLTSKDDDSSNSSDVGHVILIDDNKKSNTKIVETHEIDSDVSNTSDCVVTGEIQKVTPDKKEKPNEPCEPRRSCRVRERKSWAKVQEIVSSDDEDDIQELPSTNGFVGIPRKRPKSTVKSNPKKRKLSNNNKNQNNNAKIIQAEQNKSKGNKDSVASVKGSGLTIKKVSEPPQITPAAPILPTLEDDMFVVEAPSFIVSYIYEKPPVVCFKNFLEKLGQEIEEERIKAAKEAAEKKAKQLQEMTVEELEQKKAEKAKKKEARRRKKEEEENDSSWNEASDEGSDDDSISDEDSQSAIKEIDETLPKPSNTDSFFTQPLGKFFTNIGANLVQENVQNELIKEENRKLRREKKQGIDNKKRKASVVQLTKNLEMSQKANEGFKFELKKCNFCNFTTESQLALAHHLEVPHMKNNLYVCNFCNIEPKSMHDVLFHMHKVHGIRGRLERPLAPNQCNNCPFEDHNKGKLRRHLVSCAKKFNEDTNLAPGVDWEPPAKIMKPVRPSFMPATSFSTAARGRVIQAPNLRPSATIVRPVAPVQLRPNNLGIIVRANNIGTIAKIQPNNINMAAISRPLNPGIAPATTNRHKPVMCEICDGYILDLEQLRMHMQTIHKIRIHPKMIISKPPLNCQKCHFRFFTDHGLERHLLGSHGLVTSAIQRAAYKGKDAGRCPICGTVLKKKLLAHVTQTHKVVLKPAHLSYKCTVCGANFEIYSLFERHVYTKHSRVTKQFKNNADANSKPATKAKVAKEANAVNETKTGSNQTLPDKDAKPVKDAATVKDAKPVKDAETVKNDTPVSEQTSQETNETTKTTAKIPD